MYSHSTFFFLKKKNLSTNVFLPLNGYILALLHSLQARVEFFFGLFQIAHQQFTLGTQGLFVSKQSKERKKKSELKFKNTRLPLKL
jgi:hypothetical protein